MNWSQTKCLILTMILFSGCDQSVSDFVDAKRRVRPDKPQVATSTDSPMAFKISPGALNSATAGKAGAIRGSISITNRPIALGSDMAMTVTINRHRLVPK